LQCTGEFNPDREVNVKIAPLLRIPLCSPCMQWHPDGVWLST
jgi:hypothetical protein